MLSVIRQCPARELVRVVAPSVSGFTSLATLVDHVEYRLRGGVWACRRERLSLSLS